jgi:LuxR family maltose regulon positive regulatory protein
VTARRAQSAVVVRTRLRPPVAHPDEVPRSRLLARLDAVREPVIVVAAPRGAGKTVLLAQWVTPRVDRGRCAWVSLSGHDDSPAGVWSAMLESVRPYCAGVPAALAALLDDESTLFTEIIPELLNALASAGPLLLVLDRLDAIDHPTSRATLYEFVRRIPDSVRVVLSTARPPSGPVAALRAAGRLAEFDEDDLRLDLAETRQLLATTARRPVGATEASAVQGDYDGWATGVRLAGVALRNQPAGARPPHPLRSVEDFFRAEVLECVTSRQRRLLLYSSVLDELTPDRCAEVTGIGEAGETLAALAASSLLLRRTGSGLRCHPVLRRVLGSVLSAEQPDLVPVLHARAAERLRRDGDPGAAYEHARLAGLPGIALRAAVEAWPAAHPRILLARIDRLPWAAAGADAIAAAAAAELACGNPSRAAARLAGTADRPALAGSGDRPALAVRAWLALQRGDLAAAQRDATCVVGPNRPEGAGRWWLTMADAALGTAQVWDGHAADAVGRLAATAQEAVAVGYRDVAVRALDARTAGLLLTGQPTAAFLSASEAVALHEREPTWCAAPVIAYAYLAATAGAGHGTIPWTAGDDPEPPAPQVEAFASLLLASAFSADGDAQRARRARAQARGALAGLHSGPTLAALFEQQLSGGILDFWPTALSDRERAVLRALSGPLTLREIAAELHVSHNTVKTQVRSVFRKLGAHDRAGAVARAAAVAAGHAGPPGGEQPGGPGLRTGASEGSPPGQPVRASCRRA